jgi:hypothetical protein
MKTTFEAKCDILSRLWQEHREDEDLQDFVEYNDLGLPLAYFISEGIALPTQLAETYIGETFDLLLAALDIEDTGFTDLKDVMTAPEIED